ncbi:MAG: hypothetical protein WKF37_02705 [Bryobacteraceae bacterium]
MPVLSVQYRTTIAAFAERLAVQAQARHHYVPAVAGTAVFIENV